MVSAVADEVYSITKDASVIAFLKEQAASVREKLIDAIDALQFAPYPPGCTRGMVRKNFEVTRFVVDTSPRLQLAYSVDSDGKNVWVISIMELRFS